MQKKMLGEAICAHCGKSFQKPQTEITRNEKLGRRNYCSRSCVGKDNVNNIPEESRGNILHIPEELRHAKRDEFTGFRTFILRANRRQDEKTNVTVQCLKKLWDDQSGLCAYSGIQMILPYYKRLNDPIYTASLDRIDSSKPYEVGNLQFISIAMNHMKNTMTHKQTIELCQLISQKYLPQL